MMKIKTPRWYWLLLGFINSFLLGMYFNEKLNDGHIPLWIWIITIISTIASFYYALEEKKSKIISPHIWNIK